MLLLGSLSDSELLYRDTTTGGNTIPTWSSPT